MRVILVNGSPHVNGNTYIALSQAAETLKEDGIEAQIFHIGNKPTSGCMACGACTKLGKCVIDDKVNEFVALMKEADGLIVGSPVYYASANGSLISFLDRAFFSAFRSDADTFIHKPAASVAVARRAGTTPTIDEINKYFSISQMPIISGRYWNMVFGQTQGQVIEDKEGMQNMRILAHNMAYFLKCKEAGKNAGINPPQINEEIEFTNFIR